MRFVVQGLTSLSIAGFFFVACGGGDEGGTAGTGGSGAVASGGASTGGSATGGASGSTSGGAAGSSGSSSGGSGNSGGGGAAGSAGDAGIPDVSFPYDPPDAGPDDACAAVTASATMPPV
ncbi:MAG: hypothetical protein IT377_29325, partial [Polyangiaceae bacterium]|nr:hypothetical protein [Polyangiaceae bacterium]